MSRQNGSAIAWGACGLTYLGAVVMIVVSFEDADRANVITFASFMLACATVGAIVARRRPGNPIGWILCAVALLGLVAGITSAYSEATLGRGVDPSTVGGISEWVNNFIWTLVISPVILVLQLFPTGRPLSRRWSALVWATVAGLCLNFLAQAFSPGPLDNGVVPALNPVGIESLAGPLSVVDAVGNFLLVGVIPVSVLMLFLRFRASVGVERQQLKWLAYAGGLVLTIALGELLAEAILEVTETTINVANTFVSAGMTTIPIAIGVALLRYRLYDIDRLVNLTLVYGGLTALLASLYGLLVLSLQALLPVGSDSPLLVAASTLGVVAVSRPLRRRVQAFVDRRFYRSRYDAQVTVDRFARHLRDEVELDHLRAELVGVVDAALHPASVSVWLRTPGRASDER